MDNPNKLEGLKPNTPGRFFEIFIIFPTSYMTFRKITADFYEKRRYFNSFWGIIPIFC